MKVIFSYFRSILISSFNYFCHNWFNETWQPQITRKRDRWGNTYFEIYDPIRRKSSSFASEKEVRFWLEEIYARTNK
jgi:hypothetical protein